MRFFPTRKQALITFLMSPQGQRMLRTAYRRLATPENRERARQFVERARTTAASRRTGPPSV